jgi:hypothetical protein
MHPATPARAAGCTPRAGTAVTLRASDFDPDVFVWDTQGRALAYASRATFFKVDDVLRHIVLAKAGTHAVVVGCGEGFVLVRLASGPNRGRIGWVTSSDVR